MKNVTAEMKNILGGINNRLFSTEEYNSNLEDIIVEITKSEQEHEKKC